jgi:hypothetical protein
VSTFLDFTEQFYKIIDFQAMKQHPKNILVQRLACTAIVALTVDSVLCQQSALETDILPLVKLALKNHMGDRDAVAEIISCLEPLSQPFVGQQLIKDFKFAQLIAEAMRTHDGSANVQVRHQVLYMCEFVFVFFGGGGGEHVLYSRFFIHLNNISCVCVFCFCLFILQIVFRCHAAPHFDQLQPRISKMQQRPCISRSNKRFVTPDAWN